jgi:hypothetical protein
VSGLTARAAAAVAALAIALAGCGGSAAPVAGGSSQHPLQIGTSTRTSTVAGQRPAKVKTDTGERNEEKFGAPTPPDPCALVARTQAQSVLHLNVLSKVTAPQGPTCIYRVAGVKQTITFSYQQLSYGAAVAQLHGVTRLTVAGRPAACGINGVPLLVTQLGPQGQVLEIAGPCQIVEPLAAAAIARVAATPSLAQPKPSPNPS